MNEIDKIKANNAVMALWDIRKIVSECLVGVQYNLYIIHEI